MTDRPIIFSAPMVRALLDGRKTQTRRIMRVQPDQRTTEVSVCREKWMGTGPRTNGTGTSQWDRWQKTQHVVGDRLWVREGLRNTASGWVYRADDSSIELDRDDPRVPAMISWAHHKIDDHAPSIHMPRWASRLTLVVTDIRAQRLHDISEEDAMAEGYGTDCPVGYVPAHAASPNRYCFAYLWGQLHGPDAWEANPWVWALTFTIHRGNIDALTAHAEAA